MFWEPDTAAYVNMFRSVLVLTYFGGCWSCILCMSHRVMPARPAELYRLSGHCHCLHLGTLYPVCLFSVCSMLCSLMDTPTKLMGAIFRAHPPQEYRSESASCLSQPAFACPTMGHRLGHARMMAGGNKETRERIGRWKWNPLEINGQTKGLKRESENERRNMRIDEQTTDPEARQEPDKLVAKPPLVLSVITDKEETHAYAIRP